jgi:hypothetical protein
MTTEEINRELDELLSPLPAGYDIDAYTHMFGLNLTREEAVRFCRTITHEIDNDILKALFDVSQEDGMWSSKKEWLTAKKNWEEKWNRYLQLHEMKYGSHEKIPK